MIISRFYLIKGDNKPIYVGFTNRTIKQRFAEHKADKDFSQFDKVTIEQLDKLEYAFTWDENELYKNADEVSVREAQLVEQYGTQDSTYQKAIGGGQVWAYEKWFVGTNKDNPKFLGITGEQVEEYLEESNVARAYLRGFVSGIQDPVRVYMGSFVNGIQDPVRVCMGNFVRTMNDPVRVYMGNFVHNMNDPVRVYLGNFVNNMNDPVQVYIGHFVSHMEDPIRVYMGNFVRRIQDPVRRYLSDFVHNMKKKEEIK